MEELASIFKGALSWSELEQVCTRHWGKPWAMGLTFRPPGVLGGTTVAAYVVIQSTREIMVGANELDPRSQRRPGEQPVAIHS